MILLLSLVLKVVSKRLTKDCFDHSRKEKQKDNGSEDSKRVKVVLLLFLIFYGAERGDKSILEPIFHTLFYYSKEGFQRQGKIRGVI